MNKLRGERDIKVQYVLKKNLEKHSRDQWRRTGGSLGWDGGTQ